jgi:hypothetical protein
MGEEMQLKEQPPQKFCRGRISVVNTRTQEVIYESSNVITYNAADTMANLLAGRQEYAPSHIGYLFGPAASSMTNPDAAVPKRQHTLQNISDDLEAIGGNMIVSPLATSPLIQVDGDETLYEGNSTTVSAISDSTSPIVFIGGGFAGVGPVPTTDKYFQVALLTRLLLPGSTTPVYIPFARTQLAAGSDGLVVQSDFELAIFWTITFR